MHCYTLTKQFSLKRSVEDKKYRGVRDKEFRADGPATTKLREPYNITFARETTK